MSISPSGSEGKFDRLGASVEELDKLVRDEPRSNLPLECVAWRDVDDSTRSNTSRHLNEGRSQHFHEP